MAGTADRQMRWGRTSPEAINSLVDITKIDIRA